MRKTRLIIVAILLCALSFSLCACDLFGGSGNTSTSNGEKKDDNKVERKISFEKACENYSEQKHKRTDTELSVGATLFLKVPNTTDCMQATVSAASEISRVNDGDTSAITATLANGTATSENVKAFLRALGGEIDGTSGSQTALVMKYLQDFFSANLKFSAASGIKDGTINVKGKYNYRKEPGVWTSDGIWFAADEDYLAKFVGDGIKSFGFADEILAAELFDTSKAEDKAATIVRDDGVATYDMVFGTDGIRDFISSAAKKAIEFVNGDKQKESAINNLKNKLLSSISEDHSSTRFTAKVGKDKLPAESEAQCELAFNVSKKDVNSVVKAFYESGLIDKKTSDKINVLFWYLITNSCNLDGKPDDNEGGRMGVKLSFTVKERYYYGEDASSLEEFDKTLFVSKDEDADGRVNFEDLIVKLQEEEAVEFIKSTLEPLGEKASGIVAEITEKLDFSEEITYYEIKNNVREVLEKYKEDEEIGSIVEEILSKLFK